MLLFVSDLDFKSLKSFLNFSISSFTFVFDSEAISIPESTFSTTCFTLSSVQVISTSHSLYFSFILASMESFDIASFIYIALPFLFDKVIDVHVVHDEQHLLVWVCC